MKSLQTIVTDGRDRRFLMLCGELDDEYFRRFGELALNYKEDNQVKDALAAVLLMDGGDLCGGGCIRQFDSETAELKRIFVRESYRRHGGGSLIVRALEQKAAELGMASIVLETSHLMPWATGLYESLGYSCIPGYGPFADDDVTVYMKKTLSK